jgi:hypothetical protein
MTMLSNLKPITYVSALRPVLEPTASRPQSGIHAVPLIPQIAAPTTIAERWASYVLGACKSVSDLKTIGIWARQVAVSYTTLCETCRLIGVQPRQARDFSRVLRVVLMPSFDAGQLGTHLDISDRRTLDSILRKAGFQHGATSSGHASVASFLDHQEFIVRQNPGLKIVRDIFAVP